MEVEVEGIVEMESSFILVSSGFSYSISTLVVMELEVLVEVEVEALAANKKWRKNMPLPLLHLHSCRHYVSQFPFPLWWKWKLKNFFDNRAVIS